MQKLPHCALDDIIIAARCIERLQKTYPSLNMDNLVSFQQDELRAVQKELKESAAAAADKAMRVAQPAVAPAEPTDTAAAWYIAPSLPSIGAGVSCVTRRVIMWLLTLFG